MRFFLYIFALFLLHFCSILLFESSLAATTKKHSARCTYRAQCIRLLVQYAIKTWWKLHFVNRSMGYDTISSVRCCVCWCCCCCCVTTIAICHFRGFTLINSFTSRIADCKQNTFATRFHNNNFRIFCIFLSIVFHLEQC